MPGPLPPQPQDLPGGPLSRLDNPRDLAGVWAGSRARQADAAQERAAARIGARLQAADDVPAALQAALRDIAALPSGSAASLRAMRIAVLSVLRLPSGQRATWLSCLSEAAQDRFARSADSGRLWRLIDAVAELGRRPAPHAPGFAEFELLLAQAGDLQPRTRRALHLALAEAFRRCALACQPDGGPHQPNALTTPARLLHAADDGAPEGTSARLPAPPPTRSAGRGLLQLPVELQQAVAARLCEADLAALSRSCGALHAVLAPDLERARDAASLARAADLPQALAATLPRMRAIVHPGLLLRSLRSATLATMRLPRTQREPWLRQLSAIAAGKDLADAPRGAVMRFIEAAADLGRRPVPAARACQALNALLNDATRLTRGDTLLLYLAVAEALWAGVLNPPAWPGSGEPAALRLFMRMMSRIDYWAHESSAPVLRVMLLGLRSLSRRQLEMAHVTVRREVQLLGPDLQAIGLECLHQGLLAVMPHTDWRIAETRAMLKGCPAGQVRAAVEAVRAQLDDLHQRNT
ncbi:hypothetical protein GT347_15745 [Xylophilus rhododendri]|uniref:F-box domain-containing protein n=2 Tax=Xylophilus rhododendri TaxID=2697032 RepID=A0A857J5P9_9BURK|nr:hypothetical protein GT347_15745 [Xylophilus rhododendri]